MDVNKWVSDYNLLEDYSLRYMLTRLKCVRSAKKLKLSDTLFHFQTDSCSTEKITSSFAASLIENNGALSQLNIHTLFIKCRALDWKQLSQNLDAPRTLKKLKTNNFHDDCQVSEKDLYAQKQNFSHARGLYLERRGPNATHVDN